MATCVVVGQLATAAITCAMGSGRAYAEWAVQLVCDKSYLGVFVNRPQGCYSF